ncbi:hypothetical protein [Halococcus thailandensis]|uniref:Uncharacterized protein n=1 Tax=Halococcus thailandensis JCM 13552 TaxID=1227457 RepID=M0NDR1_9EURY|nr:hypothetical protein [Halococcus thailandensis]EMA55698.1 hypothetical protein C451_05153 [Halococcus thailandensis JCM 13552]
MRQADIQILHGLIDELVFADFRISEETQNRIYEDLPENLLRYPHISNVSNIDVSEHGFRNEVPTVEMSEEELDHIRSKVIERSSQSLRDLSEDLKISPHTIAVIKSQEDSYTDERRREVAGRLLSYYLGEIFSHWDMLNSNLKVPDGIVQFGSGPQEGLNELIQKCITETFDNPGPAVDRIEDMLEYSISNWFRNHFFQNYHADEYKRRGQRNPIYWQLESPDGSFSCFVYYHEIDENTLPKLRGQYLDPRIDELENELETLNTQTSGDNPDKELLNRKEKVQNDLNDIREFRDTVDEMIDDGVTVDVEKGIWDNIKEWDQYEVLETGLPKLKSSYSR